jgi:hypothetical protein
VTDAEIADVVGNLALNILTRYYNILPDTDNEFPLVTPLAHGSAHLMMRWRQWWRNRETDHGSR